MPSNWRPLRKGQLLRRIKDNRVFYIDTVNNDGTYTIRSYLNDVLYGRYTETQLKQYYTQVKPN